jgi:two-component system, OmpR family, KDP operon response regulator KdpE
MSAPLDRIETGLILVVDDEPQIHRFLSPALTAAGYTPLRADTGAAALKIVAARAPDLIILDLGLPDIDGHEVLARLRAFSNVPVIVLSARDREAEKVAILDYGADDYVTKPFAFGELLARMRKALRAHNPRLARDGTFSFGGLSIDPLANRVMVHGKDLALTKKQYDLLVLLTRNIGKVLTHTQILTAVWGESHVNHHQYLRIYVAQLRRILTDANAGAWIETSIGSGYRLVDTHVLLEGKQQRVTTTPNARRTGRRGSFISR